MSRLSSPVKGYEYIIDLKDDDNQTAVCLKNEENETYQSGAFVADNRLDAFDGW